MKLLRYAVEDRAVYGLLKDGYVTGIGGSIFHDFELTSFSCRLDELRILPPVQPTKIICVGLNYVTANADLNESHTRLPTYTFKPPSAFLGPGEAIKSPKIGGHISCQGTLAIVMKRKAKNISEDAAMAAILGYTCLNDVTERSLIGTPGQDFRAKAFDTFAPFGPSIETDLDIWDSEISTLVNNRIVLKVRCPEMIFSVPFLVKYMSQCMTLYPGDIITTGTPLEFASVQRGDEVHVSIERIGVLKNFVN